MAIAIACQCGAKFQVPDQLAGRTAACPKCGSQIVIQSLSASIEAIPPTPPNSEFSGPVANSPFNPIGALESTPPQQTLPPMPAAGNPPTPIPTAVPQAILDPSQYKVSAPLHHTQSNRRWVVIAAAVVILGLVAGGYLLTQYNQDPEEVGTPGLTSAEASSDSEPVVSEAEAIGIARVIEEGINGGDSFAVSPLWDIKRLVDTATEPIEKIFPGPQQFSEAKQGFESAFIPASQNWAQQIADAIGFDGSFMFLRSRTYRGYRTALFRLLHADSAGIDYHEFILDKVNGEVRIIDNYIFTDGETRTETIQRAFTLIVKLMKNEGITPADQANIQQLNSTYQFGDYSGVIRTFNQLPALVRAMKRMRIIYLSALLEVDESQYLQEFQAFKRDFPTDSSIDLLSIDFFTVQADITNAIACIDRLDESLDGDPYLDAMRTAIYMVDNDQVKAKEFADRYLENAPASIDAVWNLADYALYFEDHPLLLKALKILSTDFAIEFEDLRTIEGYEAFTRSPEFQQWLQFQQQI